MKEELARLAEHFPVRYLILFGSAAEGRLRIDSDVDVAVKTGLSDPKERFDVRVKLASRLEGVFSRRVDVVILEDAPVDLAYEVFRKGLLVYCRDYEEYLIDKTKALMMYLDFSFVLATYWRRSLEVYGVEVRSSEEA